jgi:hypothetical protein
LEADEKWRLPPRRLDERQPNDCELRLEVQVAGHNVDARPGVTALEEQGRRDKAVVWYNRERATTGGRPHWGSMCSNTAQTSPATRTPAWTSPSLRSPLRRRSARRTASLNVSVRPLLLPRHDPVRSVRLRARSAGGTISHRPAVSASITTTLVCHRQKAADLWRGV